ncbi:MAG TPA: EamA family transporter [Pyrinomonadaceae bacterium]
MARREKILAYGSWLAVCFFWGTTYLAIRVGLETLPPTLFGGLRFLLAGTALLAFVLWRGERLPRGREWWKLGLVGVLLLGVGNGVVVWAEQWISSGMTALLISTSPFWVVGAERLGRGGERAGANVLLGMLLGFAGMALLVGPELFGAQLDARFLLGLVLLQVGCASWSGGSVFAKRHPTEVAPLMSAAVQMLAGGAALALAGTLRGEWASLEFSGRSLGAFLYLVVFGSLVAYTAYTYAIQKLPLSLVSTYSYINPVIAVLLGWLLLGEPLGWRVAAGAGVILCGVAVVKGGAPRRETEDAGRVAVEPKASEDGARAATQKVCSAGAD